MATTLLFYAAFAIGEVALVALAINVVHGFAWKMKWHEKATIACLAIGGLASLELTRRYWLVPVGAWPALLRGFAAGCCLVEIGRAHV